MCKRIILGCEVVKHIFPACKILFYLFKTFGGDMVMLENGSMVQSGQAVMLVIAGISLVIAALAVFGIKTKKATK